MQRRSYLDQDYKAFLPLYENKEQMQYFGSGKTFTEYEVKNLIAGNAAANQWPVETRPVERFFWTGISREGIGGRICIIFKKDQNEKEIFGCIIPLKQGKRIAAKVSKAVIDYVYEKCGGGFFATVHPDNTRSVKVIKKLGFIKGSTENVQQYGSVRDYYKWEDTLKNSNEPGWKGFA